MQQSLILYLLIFAFLVLCFIYSILALYCTTCLWKVFKKKSTNFFAKTCYIFIFLTCVSLTLFQGLFLKEAIQAISRDTSISQEFKYLLLDTVYVPDSLFWLFYLSLFWYLLILFDKGYLKTGDDLYNGRNFNPQAHTGKVKFIMVIYIILQITFILLYNIPHLIDEVLFIILDIALNASIPLSLIIAQLYLNIKFSGAIFSSSYLERKTRKFNQLTVLMALMRLPQIILNILTLLYKETLFDFLNGKVSTVEVYWQILFIAFGVADFLLSTVIPFQVAMSEQFLNVFLMDLSPKLLRDYDQQNDGPLQNVDYDQSVNVSIQNNPQNKIALMNYESKDYKINFQDIVLEQSSQIQKRLNGLGTIRAGRIFNQQSDKQQLMIFRFIEIKQLSTYVVDEIRKDIIWINHFIHKHVAPICGYSTTNTQFILIYKNYENGSLHSILHQDQEKHNLLRSSHSQQNENKGGPQNQYEYKIDLVTQIAQAIQYLHTQAPPVCHGHLTPYNILLTKNFHVKLSDLGLSVLKKYCNLLNGYGDKSQYSAPEVFLEKSGLVLKTEISRDIYSFGLIMYEIFTETIPFGDLNLKQCQVLIEEQQSRPKMKDFIPEDISNLIKHCWQQDPTKRPTIQTIVQVLKDIKSNLE